MSRQQVTLAPRVSFIESHCGHPRLFELVCLSHLGVVWGPSSYCFGVMLGSPWVPRPFIPESSWGRRRLLELSFLKHIGTMLGISNLRVCVILSPWALRAFLFEPLWGHVELLELSRLSQLRLTLESSSFSLLNQLRSFWSRRSSIFELFCGFGFLELSFSSHAGPWARRAVTF